MLSSLVYFFSCLSPENHIKENPIDKKTFDSNVLSFQNKFIKGFEIEDHTFIMSLFTDSVKWTGPAKKLLNQSST